MVGIPYDQQNDLFVVAEWGFEGLPQDKVPDWISFKNETIEQGIRFKVNPVEQAVGETYTVYYVLQDFNERGSMSEKFTFTLTV